MSAWIFWMISGGVLAGTKKANQDVELVAGHASFRDGRYLGGLSDALGAGDSQRAQLPAPYQRKPGGHDGEVTVHAAGDQVGVDG